MKWKDLDAAECFRVVELARTGQVPLRELCRTFGVSRQTLYRAMETTERAATAALTPKKRGRKPRPASQAEAELLRAEKQKLEEDLRHWKTKYEVARSILELQRKLDRGETLPGEKKLPRSPRRRPKEKGRARSTRCPGSGTTTRMADGDDGRSDEDLGPGADEVAADA